MTIAVLGGGISKLYPAENKKLAETLSLKDREIEGLNSKLEKLSKEKGLVKGKVETLLERVEGLIQTA